MILKRLHLFLIFTRQRRGHFSLYSLILRAAGLLSGLKATSRWAMLDRLLRWGAIPLSQRIVENNKVITVADVSAGIDMVLVLVEKKPVNARWVKYCSWELNMVLNHLLIPDLNTIKARV